MGKRNQTRGRAEWVIVFNVVGIIGGERVAKWHLPRMNFDFRFVLRVAANGWKLPVRTKTGELN